MRAKVLGNQSSPFCQTSSVLLGKLHFRSRLGTIHSPEAKFWVDLAHAVLQRRIRRKNRINFLYFWEYAPSLGAYATPVYVLSNGARLLPCLRHDRWAD